MATKKTKHVETPIDQRETFVSIQKSFADSEISVEEKLKTLYALQQADTRIDKILQLRGELPLEVETLENELAELNAKAQAINEAIDENAKVIAENKHNIVECENQIEKYKAQLEAIQNSREFDSLSKEIENQDLLLQIAQKVISEAKESTLAKKQDLENIKDRIAVKEDDLAAKKEELAGIVDSTKDEEEKLLAEREACAAKIDARTMSAYDRIRKSCHNHLAVVPVYNQDSCGGCLSTIPPQKLIDIESNKKMIICEYCGRILINPKFE